MDNYDYNDEITNTIQYIYTIQHFISLKSHKVNTCTMQHITIGDKV